MSCEFINQLKKLRKLSPESIDNANELDPFKKYLHVESQVERELRVLLRQINAKQSKCLILVCGSAGDGKSHTVAFFRFADPERLLDEYILYNDATASRMPTQTALERLAEKLEPFNDSNYDIPDHTKMIIAINLGTLNNFIDSEQGKNFSKLKKYVETSGILSGYMRNNAYQAESVFQYVSFSDYQLFTLTDTGINTIFLEQLLSKVFDQNSDNPFNQSFHANANCSYCKRCPVRHNYEFLSDPEHRKKVIDRIVEIVIKDKAIVSTREVLNLLYDLLVHPEFDPTIFFNPANETAFLQNYILCTTPMLLDESGDSSVMRTMQKYDILKKRTEEIDTDTLQFHSLENIEEIYLSATNETAYEQIHEIANIAVLGATKPDLKKITYRFIVRLLHFKNESVVEPVQDLYHEYISYLYYQNAGQTKRLRKLYDGIKYAVMSWNGQFDSNQICIDDTNEKYWILEQLYLQSAPPAGVTSNQMEVMRFAPVLNLRLKKDGAADTETAEISVDYTLFKMIFSIKEGYRPTIQDKNHHTDFVSFVNRVIEFGNKASRIILVSKEDPAAPKLSFEKEFGYEFKVI